MCEAAPLIPQFTGLRGTHHTFLILILCHRRLLQPRGPTAPKIQTSQRRKWRGKKSPAANRHYREVPAVIFFPLLLCVTRSNGKKPKQTAVISPVNSKSFPSKFGLIKHKEATVEVFHVHLNEADWRCITLSVISTLIVLPLCVFGLCERKCVLLTAGCRM